MKKFVELFWYFLDLLESLDSALHEREVCKLEIDSLKEQNEQLFQQYEREKNFHKEYQQVRFFVFISFLLMISCFDFSVIFK